MIARYYFKPLVPNDENVCNTFKVHNNKETSFVEYILSNGINFNLNIDFKIFYLLMVISFKYASEGFDNSERQISLFPLKFCRKNKYR